MKKRFFAVALAAMMVATLASSCGSKGGTDNTSTAKNETSKTETAKGGSLNIWMPPYEIEGGTTDKEFWTKSLQPLTEEKGVKLNLEVVPWGDYETKYLTGITSGEGPDVGYMYNEMLADFINMGALEPLDDYMTDAEKANYLYINNGVINGKQYTLPIVVGNARILYCNMDILKAAGINEPPKTWEDMMSTAQAIKDNVTDKDPMLMEWADPAIGALNDIFYPYLWQNGGDIFDKDGKLTLSTPEGIEVAQYLLDLKTKGLVPDKATSMKGDDCKQAFLRGEVGMWVSATSFAKELDEKGINWDYTSSLTKKQQGTFIASDALVLLSAAKDKQLAADAMKLMTSKDVMVNFHKELTSFPPLNKDEEYVDNKKFETMYTTETEMMRTLPVAAGSFKVYDTLYKNLQLMIQGQMTPEEALKETETYAESVLK